jgi:hypothetical protein
VMSADDNQRDWVTLPAALEEEPKRAPRLTLVRSAASTTFKKKQVPR